MLENEKQSLVQMKFQFLRLPCSKEWSIERNIPMQRYHSQIKSFSLFTTTTYRNHLMCFVISFWMQKQHISLHLYTRYRFQCMYFQLYDVWIVLYWFWIRDMKLNTSIHEFKNFIQFIFWMNFKPTYWILRYQNNVTFFFL